MRFPASLYFFLLLASAGFVRADVTLAPLFGDHAVLQRGKPIPIWGRADVGERITVAFLDQRVNATTGADGRWLVYLEAVDARNEGADLVVAGKNTLALHDVVVGEVWLCSGSAAMEMSAATLRTLATNGAALRTPLIRQIKIEATAALLPAESARARGWESLDAGTTGTAASTGFFFARDVFQKLGVPVGIICASASAAPVDAWLSPVALARDPLAADASERRKQRSAAADVSPGSPDKTFAATSLFNGTIAPLLPYALRGVLWQEDTAPADRAEDYRLQFPAVIAAWRTHFAQGELPFYWVQLPASSKADRGRAGALAAYREAQAQALALPDTAQVIGIDVDSNDDSSDSVFQTIGRRLALVAKNRVYGIVSDDTGPGFIDATREGPAMRVRLSHANSGLVAHEKPVQSLEIAGADRVFRAASARIERESLLVSSPEVRVPVAVRYAWRNAPEANLYNGAGQPAAPFRSDSW